MKIRVRESLDVGSFDAVKREIQKGKESIDEAAFLSQRFVAEIDDLLDKYGLRGLLRFSAGGFLGGYLQLHLQNLTHSVVMSIGIGEDMSSRVLDAVLDSNADGSPFVVAANVQDEPLSSRECETFKALLDAIEGYFKEWTE